MDQKYIDRFWSKADKSTECWLWTACLNEKGYGYFFNGKRMVRAHRYAYEVAKGKIPKNAEIDHLCKKRSCVKPSHLEAVSHQINCSRGFGKSGKTHCKNGHEFTPENTYQSKTRYGVGRNCVACQKRYQQKRRMQLAAV